MGIENQNLELQHEGLSVTEAEALQEANTAVVDPSKDPSPPAADPAVSPPELPGTSVGGDPLAVKVEPSTPEAVEDVTPAFVPKMPANPERVTAIDGRLAEIKAASDALFEKFDAGDLTAKEYHEQSEALGSERIELVSEKATLRTAQDYNKLNVEQQWEHDQRAFFGAKENDIFYLKGEDGAIRKDGTGNPEIDPVMYGALDAAVRHVAASKEAQGKSNNWVLGEARRRVTQRFNMAQTPPQTPPAKQTVKKDPPPVGPLTLAGLPSAIEADDVGGNEFAEIDKLIESGDVLGYESALASMTQAQQDRYLNVGHPNAPEYRRKAG